jgi:hypothetical protein
MELAKDNGPMNNLSGFSKKVKEQKEIQPPSQTKQLRTKRISETSNLFQNEMAIPAENDSCMDLP